MKFSMADQTEILKLKSKIASYYNLQMKKIGKAQLDSLFFNDCIITGGCISSLYHDEPVKDIDVYAKTAKSMQTIKNHILNNCNDAIATYDKYTLDDQGNKMITVSGEKLITDNAVTLTNDVQFIYLADAPTSRRNFDFVHCMPWYDIKTQKFYISKTQFDCIKNKQLVKNPTYTGEVKEPRYNKYFKKGWAWAPSQITSQKLDTNTLMTSAIA